MPRPAGYGAGNESPNASGFKGLLGSKPRAPSPEEQEEEAPLDDQNPTPFVTAHQQWMRDRNKPNRQSPAYNRPQPAHQENPYSMLKPQPHQRANAGAGSYTSRGRSPAPPSKTLGVKRKFAPPARYATRMLLPAASCSLLSRIDDQPNSRQRVEREEKSGDPEKEEMINRIAEEQNLEPKMVEMILNEIMHTGDPITFDDIGKGDFGGPLLCGRINGFP